MQLPSLLLPLAMHAHALTLLQPQHHSSGKAAAGGKTSTHTYTCTCMLQCVKAAATVRCCQRLTTAAAFTAAEARAPCQTPNPTHTRSKRVFGKDRKTEKADRQAPSKAAQPSSLVLHTTVKLPINMPCKYTASESARLAVYAFCQTRTLQRERLSQHLLQLLLVKIECSIVNQAAATVSSCCCCYCYCCSAYAPSSSKALTKGFETTLPVGHTYTHALLPGTQTSNSRS